VEVLLYINDPLNSKDASRRHFVMDRSILMTVLGVHHMSITFAGIVGFLFRTSVLQFTSTHPRKWPRHQRMKGAMHFLVDCMFDLMGIDKKLIMLTKKCRDINIPFPTTHLASIALKVLSVDKELSPLVHRKLALVSSPPISLPSKPSETSDRVVLNVVYTATTNRMLRVSVNGFFESLRLVVQVMEDLDIDVALIEGKEDMAAVQGLGEVAAGV
jgi:EKC/KEOPS complex subunit PCC1/LAGE3